MRYAVFNDEHDYVTGVWTRYEYAEDEAEGLRRAGDDVYASAFVYGRDGDMEPIDENEDTGQE